MRSVLSGTNPSCCDDPVVLFRHPPGCLDDLIFVVWDDLDSLEVDAEIEAVLGEEVGVGVPGLTVQHLVADDC